MQQRRPVRRALLSVSDKAGIVEFAQALSARGVELLSTGKFDGMSLCSEVRPLEALVESLEDMAQGKGSKYILRP